MRLKMGVVNIPCELGATTRPVILQTRSDMRNACGAAADARTRNIYVHRRFNEKFLESLTFVGQMRPI